MFYAIGQQTQTMYAMGSKAECMRKLSENYPSFRKGREHSKGHKGAMEKVLPEPIKILRRK